MVNFFINNNLWSDITQRLNGSGAVFRFGKIRLCFPVHCALTKYIMVKVILDLMLNKTSKL